MNSLVPYLTAANLAQVGIAIFGVTAVALSQSKHFTTRRWASVFGLVGQPFWIYAAWHAQQWGILALCALYTASWAQGLYTHWIAVDKWTDKACIDHVLGVIRKDGRWMAHNPVAAALTSRYEKLLSPGWEREAFPHVGYLRAELGIEPYQPAWPPLEVDEKEFIVDDKA